MLPILNIGPLAIQLPGLILIAGLWVGTSLAERTAPLHGINPNRLNGMVLVGLVAGLLGGRVGYALEFFELYLENPQGLLSLNPSTLSLEGGLLTGLVSAIIYGSRAGLPLWPTLDALAPGLALFGFALGLSHIASGDAFGVPSQLPWAIELWGARRHPTQIYESLAGLLILIAIWRLREHVTFPGFHFLCWLCLASLSRLLLEAFRGDSILVLGNLREAQLVSLGVLLAALLGLHLRARRSGPA